MRPLAKAKGIDLAWLVGCSGCHVGLEGTIDSAVTLSVKVTGAKMAGPMEFAKRVLPSQ